MIFHNKHVAIRIASIGVAALILLAYEKLRSGTIKALAIMLMSALLAYLWTRSMSDRSQSEKRRFLAAAPKASEIGKGAVTILLIFPWTALCGLAIRYRFLNDSMATALVTFVPAGALFLLGVYFIGRAYYRGYRNL
jgi:hypothetical protein